MIIEYLAPIKGEHLDISKAPDDTFSQGLLGPGFLILPTEHKVYAPIDGKITLIFPTKHAIAIHHFSGTNILIHVGFGTVDLKGEGFKLHKKLHDEVKQGDLLLEFDYHLIKDKVASLATPVVFLQKNSITLLKKIEHTEKINYILDVL